MVNLKKAIKERGFTLEQVGKAIGKTKSGMSQAVSSPNPQLETLRLIASAIGCKVGDFFKDEVTEELHLTCPVCGARLKIERE